MDSWILPILALAIVTVASSSNAYAEEKAQMVRLSKLVVDPSQLEAYRSALREEVSASVRLEPGVLTLYAVRRRTAPRISPFSGSMPDRAAYEIHMKSVVFFSSTRPGLSTWSGRWN